MTDNRKNWIWIFSTFLLTIVVVLLSVTIGVIGLDDGDDTTNPVGPQPEIKTGNYEYITYIEHGKINRENEKSLVDTIEYILLDEENNVVEQGIEVIDKALGIFLFNHDADFGINTFKASYDEEGELITFEQNTPLVSDFVEKMSFAFDSKGYLYAGYKFNTLFEGGDFNKNYLAFFMDVVGDHYDAHTDVHDFGLLFNWNWGTKNYSHADFGATITANFFFGDLDEQWNTIQANDGAIEVLHPFLHKEIISFYLDSDGHVELYNKQDEILIKGDFDFMDVSVSGTFTIPPIENPFTGGEIFSGVEIPNKLTAYIGFNQDELSNEQETAFNQDYVVKLDITPAFKFIGWEPFFVLTFNFNFEFLKIPQVTIRP